IQEHYYGLEKNDVVARFFQERKSFAARQIEKTFIIDYVNDLTIVAVIGQPGFERILAVGEYYHNPNTNMAEIAFSVVRTWQGRGLCSVVIKKLAEAARGHGIKGLTAYTSKNNRAMIKLFHTLEYQVKKVNEDDMVYLEAIFNHGQR
ncbi:MAG: GNAT family N-acetyltransferase, partial [Desulforhopalus sp.]|nr:GNAT family N-acetyltransferase [Desulforhopalus sp.]